MVSCVIILLSRVSLPTGPNVSQASLSGLVRLSRLGKSIAGLGDRLGDRHTIKIMKEILVVLAVLAWLLYKRRSWSGRMGRCRPLAHEGLELELSFPFYRIVKPCSRFRARSPEATVSFGLYLLRWVVPLCVRNTHVVDRNILSISVHASVHASKH